MKVCVFGAGAIGGHLAARMARGGAEVSVIARGAQLAAIQARGLHIDAPDATFDAKVAATSDPATLGPQDAVLVTVKSPALPSVAAAIAPLLGPDTPVVFVMNGIPWWYFDQHGGAMDGTRIENLDPGDAVRTAIGPARAIGGVVYSACTVTEPGVIQVEHARNRLVMGEINDVASARIEAIASPLRAGGFTIEVPADIRTAVWTKLLMNMSSGPMAVLTQSPPRDNVADPAIERALRAVYAEGLAVARALGRDPVIDVDATLANSRKMGHKPSILQDLELGRPMEVATMFEAPLHLAQLAGVATPTLELLVAMARQRARAAGLYGA